jgi:hypothetical protein
VGVEAACGEGWVCAIAGAALDPLKPIVETIAAALIAQSVSIRIRLGVSQPNRWL